MAHPADPYGRYAAGPCWLGKPRDDDYSRTPHGARKTHSHAGHRFAYEVFYGPVADDMVLDHLCNIKRCYRPEHLALVTRAENNRRAREGETHYAPGRCWLGTPANQGYVRTRAGANPGGRAMAHRIAYEVFYGPIPEGMVLDHLCRRQNCYNPAHVEPVSTGENKRRGALSDTCHRGHPWTDESTYNARGWRVCRICQNDNRRNKRTHCVNGHLLNDDEVAWIVEAHGRRRQCSKCLKERQAKRQKEILDGTYIPGPPGGRCKKGHLFDEANTRYLPNGRGRQCKNCQRDKADELKQAYQDGIFSPQAVKTHCKYGHPFDETNTWIVPSTGKRKCRICRHAAYKRRKAKTSSPGRSGYSGK